MGYFLSSSSLGKDSLTKNGKAFVFLRPWTPLAMGHTGWGFQIGPNTYGFGATENTGEGHFLWISPAIVAKGERNDWWGRTGTFMDMKTEISKAQYTEYAALPIAYCSPKEAIKTALETRQLGYGLFTNNCLDHVYAIMKAYGVGNLPWMQTHPAPRAWFGALGWKTWGKSETMKP